MKVFRTLAGRIVVLVVRSYQRIIAPWLPPSCRFTPSCSAYMIEAVQVHGPWRGAWLGCRRLMRCHPLSTHGFDPVPPKADAEESRSQKRNEAP